MSPFELSKIHETLGSYLAQNIAEFIETKEIEFRHPQGVKTGFEFDEKNLMIITFMRAGLYVANGIRKVFRFAPLELVSPIKNQGIPEAEFDKIKNNIKGKKIILADSVVNTGSTLFPIISQIENFSPDAIHIASIVMPKTTAESIKGRYKDDDEIFFHVARTSNNSYVGKGKTDTGNRLFGSFYD